MRTALIQLKRSLEEKKSISERANRLAYFDPLTGMANRETYNTVGASILSNNPHAVLYLIDLDNFKRVNDQHGHSVGDELLIEVAVRIAKQAELHEGLVARLGGDEFAVIIPEFQDGISKEQFGQDLIENLRLELMADGIALTAHASLGVAQLDYLDEKSLGGLTKAADTALYKSKSDGRNSLSVFDAAMALNEWRTREIASSIPRALSNGEFEVFFQPQVDLASGNLCGLEALVRWRKDGKLLGPDQFIKIAEDHGLIADIDLWVLRTATKTVSKWNEYIDDDLSVSVNLSAKHFDSLDIIEHVGNALEASELRPELLTLELTETGLLEDFNMARQLLSGFKTLGVETSLDDFGTGYSSLAYLRNLEVTELKIDRSFMRELDTRNASHCIMEGMANIAHSLGLRVVVEGVETLEQLNKIKRIGVQVGQGYLLGKPADEATTFARIMDELCEVRSAV